MLVIRTLSLETPAVFASPSLKASCLSLEKSSLLRGNPITILTTVSSIITVPVVVVIKPLGVVRGVRVVAAGVVVGSELLLGVVGLCALVMVVVRV